MEVINVQQAKTHLSKYLEEVAQGEEFILGKSGKPIAKLIPYVEEKPPIKLGGVEGWVSDDCWEVTPEIESMFYGEEPMSKGSVATLVAEEELKYNEE